MKERFHIYVRICRQNGGAGTPDAKTLLDGSKSEFRHCRPPFEPS